MRNETNMCDLFPEPNPFSMEHGSIARYRRDSYIRSAGGGVRCARSQGRRHGIQPNAVVGLSLVALLVLAFGITAANSNLQSGTSDAIWAKNAALDDATEASNRSTPQSDWRQGSVPMLYQTDPQWSGHGYAGATIETSGCGPTCLSMVYIALTGKTDLDPEAMADFSTRCGYIDGEQTTWALMNEGATQLGLVSREVPADASQVEEALSCGYPLILSMGKGDFTTEGHFIVACGTDDSGNLIIRDPNSPERSAKAWDTQVILGQCRNIWAFSV